MQSTLIRINGAIKGLVLVARPHLFLGWLRRPALLVTNVLALTCWISRVPKGLLINDFFVFKRQYAKRLSLYQTTIDHLGLAQEPIDYLEFGVCGGTSFRWWLEHCPHPDSRFFGFDTFEGLPEDWGTFSKGDMAAGVPEVNDARAEFVAGLFQDSMQPFLATYSLKTSRRKVIHLDADLFSSTLFVLTSLAPYLKKGDVLLFDEFNVPNHEFFAFKIFTESFYVKTRVVGAVNNYLQVAFVIE